MSLNSENHNMSARDSKQPMFPSDPLRFEEWKMKMESYLAARDRLSYVLSVSPSITFTKKMSTDDYATWLNYCDGRFQKADFVLASAKESTKAAALKDVDVVFQREVRACREVCDILINSFSEKQISIVNTVFQANAYEMWQTINNAYGVINTTDTLHSLMNQLININKQPTERTCS